MPEFRSVVPEPSPEGSVAASHSEAFGSSSDEDGEGDAGDGAKEGEKAVGASQSGFSSSSDELEEQVQHGDEQAGQGVRESPVAASKSGFSSSSSSSEDLEDDKVKVNKNELRPELMGQLSPQKASAADSAAMVAQAVRRGSVSVANAKNKAAPSMRQFNDAKKKQKGGDKGHRRNSRVIVMEDEPGGAAEKIERHSGKV